jgi:hypothetical protein
LSFGAGEIKVELALEEIGFKSRGLDFGLLELDLKLEFIWKSSDSAAALISVAALLRLENEEPIWW